MSVNQLHRRRVPAGQTARRKPENPHLNPFRGSEARNIGCYLDPMRTRFDALTILFGLLILVAVTAGVMA
jgi:hypothetical protein